MAMPGIQELGAMVQAQVAATARTAEAVERLVAAHGQMVREENKGLSGALRKVLKTPETWKPETREQQHATWQEFSFGLKAHLVALDAKYEGDFVELEASSATPSTWTT